MSKHGLHVEDFKKDKKNTKDFILHRARCGKLKPSQTCLDVLYEKFETHKKINTSGWRNSYFPIDRQSDWKSEADKFTENDKNYGNVTTGVPTKNLSKISSISESPTHVRKVGLKKGWTPQKTRTESETNKRCLVLRENAPKHQFSTQSLYVNDSNVSTCFNETARKVATDQRHFNERLQELSKQKSQSKENSKLISKSPKPQLLEYSKQNRLCNVAARKRRRSLAYVSDNKSKAVDTTSGAGKQLVHTGDHHFASPRKAFSAFTMFGEQKIKLQPTFPDRFTEDDPSEFRVLTAQELCLIIEFDQAKTANGEEEFPFEMIIHEKRTEEYSSCCCNTITAFHPEVSTFTSEKLEVKGTMSCTHSDDKVNFNLKMFPAAASFFTGLIKYKGTYRRQMKPGGQYMTWKFKL